MLENYENHIRRICYQQYGRKKMSAADFTRIRFHRKEQRREVIAYKYVDREKRPCQNIVNTR